VPITTKIASMALVVAGAVALLGATAGGQVSFRDIQRDGSVKVIGNFGLPVGQIITLEGRRAKPLKTTNEQTLEVEKVNGKALPTRDRTFDIQIENVAALPEGVPIVVKGFEALHWVGAPDTNWYVGAYFVVTEVVGPATLQFKPWLR